nr:MFS transporter [Paenibacillus sp.]
MNNHVSSAQYSAVADTPRSERFPWGGLIALAMAGFIGVLTETLPAGLLPQISAGLGISEALTGQLVTSYALGSLLAAIPLTTATSGWRRRPLLLLCLIGFLVFNSVTALSANYSLTLVSRFMAGVSAGVLWGMVAGYARRMVADPLKGRAMAVAMVGTPFGLAIGVPAGTFLGAVVGWRAVFGLMSLLTVLLVVWILWKMPDYPGQQAGTRLPLHKVIAIPGVRSVLLVVLTWVLAHNILYTYIAPYLAEAGFAQRVDLMLLIFGITSIIGTWLTGIWIDRLLRPLVLIGLISFTVASTLFGIGSGQPMIMYAAVAIWGLTYGGSPTLLQTAIAETAGESADVGQSMLVTVWNLAIGGGGLVGAILFETIGVGSFPWALCILLLLGLIIAWRAKEHGFRSK